MERVRENWSALLVLALLIGGATYIHTIDTGLGSFLWIVAGIVVLVALLGPGVRTATQPVWSKWKRSRREAITGYMFAAPFIIGFLVFTFGPMLFSLYASFSKYDIINPPVWKGWNYNYGFIFQHDPNFPVALRNTFWYVLVKTPVIIIVSLIFALLLNQRVPGVRFFRTIFYMPTVVTGVAAIFLWVWVLNPRGILNSALGALHAYQPLWFYDPAWTKPGLVVMSVWYLGAPMLILLAGLNGIPKSLYEAAEVEGAGIIRKFRNITLPMLSPTLFFIILTNIIGAFQVFNSAYVISTSSGVSNTQLPGDPDQSLLFYEVYMYTKFAAPVRDVGYACALAWILFVIIMIITGIQLYLSRRWVYYES
ncbi:MAG TPA: sugar ABC transporter permease [Chloroflexota bacterium]